MGQKADNSKKDSSILVAEINKKATITAAMLTIISSLIGSIVVALIVGNLTIKASLDAAKIRSHSQEKLLKETIKSQMELASKSNSNQLKIALKTIENNQQIATRALKNALDVIERDNALKLKAQIKKENRERASKTALAMNYFYSDITLRTLYMEGIFNKVDSFIKKISKNIKSHSIRSIVETQMEAYSYSKGSITWGVGKLNPNYIKYLGRNIQRNVLLFYREVDKFNYLSGKYYSNESNDFKSSLIDSIYSKTAADSVKKIAYDIYMKYTRAYIGSAKLILLGTIQVGLKDAIFLQKRLGLKNDIFKKKLKKYEKMSGNIENNSFSTLNQAFSTLNQIMGYPWDTKNHDRK